MIAPGTLPASHESVTLIDDTLVGNAVEASRNNPRGRIIQPLHKRPASVLQRMINAIQPGSYIQPHQHANPPKVESLIVVRGAFRILFFDSEGTLTAFYDLAAQSPLFGIDIEPGIWHTLFATMPDSVIFEVKPGPWISAKDKDFASWAPREGSSDAAGYMEALIQSTK